MNPLQKFLKISLTEVQKVITYNIKKHKAIIFFSGLNMSSRIMAKINIICTFSNPLFAHFISYIVTKYRYSRFNHLKLSKP